MVDIKTLHVGDRIKIVDQWVTGCHQNLDGEMDEWLGKVLTVTRVYSDWNFVKAFENGWHWYSAAIDYVVTDEPAAWDYDGGLDALSQLL